MFGYPTPPQCPSCNCPPPKTSPNWPSSAPYDPSPGSTGGTIMVLRHRVIACK